MSTPFVEPERAALLRSYFSTQKEVDTLLASEGSAGESGIANFRELSVRLDQLKERYREGVPLVPLSRCPFSGEVVHHSIDPYGLDGLWWDYGNSVRPLESLPNTYFALSGAVWLSGEIEPFPFVCRPGAAAPYVIPRMLAHESVKAVLSYTAVGSHHAFAMFYFADPIPFDIARVNTWGTDHHVFRGPEAKLYRAKIELDLREADFDLEPWINAGKLLWIAPNDRAFAFQGNVDGCPFLGLKRGPGFYRIYGGQVWSDGQSGPAEPPRGGTTRASQPSPEPSEPHRKQPSEIACGHCGALNPPNKKFCGECGNRLLAETSAPPPTNPAAALEPSSEPIAPQGPKITVRNWFRSLNRVESGQIRMVELEDISALAAALRRVRDEKLIPEETFKALHGALRVKGPDDTVWTVGLGSLRWSRLANEKWEPADPPEYAFLDARMLHALMAISPQSAAPLRPAATAKSNKSTPKAGRRL